MKRLLSLLLCLCLFAPTALATENIFDAGASNAGASFYQPFIDEGWLLLSERNAATEVEALRSRKEPYGAVMANVAWQSYLACNSVLMDSARHARLSVAFVDDNAPATLESVTQRSEQVQQSVMESYADHEPSVTDLGVTTDGETYRASHEFAWCMSGVDMRSITTLVVKGALTAVVMLDAPAEYIETYRDLFWENVQRMDAAQTRAQGVPSYQKTIGSYTVALDPDKAAYYLLGNQYIDAGLGLSYCTPDDWVALFPNNLADELSAVRAQDVPYADAMADLAQEYYDKTSSTLLLNGGKGVFTAGCITCDFTPTMQDLVDLTMVSYGESLANEEHTVALLRKPQDLDDPASQPALIYEYTFTYGGEVWQALNSLSCDRNNIIECRLIVHEGEMTDEIRAHFTLLLLSVQTDVQY